MNKETLLITCFEPFGGSERNMSFEAVSLLAENIEGVSIHKLTLPVEFENAAKLAKETFDKIDPKWVLCIGEAGGRNAVTPEMVAINLRFARIPDNKGFQPKDEPIRECGENALFSTFNTRKITDAINAAGIPAEVSYSAGTYVCNDLLYLMLDHIKNSPVPCGFIHVPADENFGIDRMAEAIKVAIETVIKQ